MFIRKKDVTDKKKGISYSYYNLVETIVNDGKVSQKSVLYLGKLDLTKQQLKILAKLIETRIYGKHEIADFPELSAIADKFYQKYQQKLSKEAKHQEQEENANYEEVDLNTATTEKSRSFGSEFVINSFWEKLKFDNILRHLDFSQKDIAISKALILGRIISPGSELHTYYWYHNSSSLKEFPGYDLTDTGKDSFYVMGDILYNHKAQIEKQLRKNIQQEYSLKDSIYLYDLTNTYFESSKQNSNLAKHGKSKEKRSDCPLVTLALVVDQSGFPVYSEIYRGNQSEPETLSSILEKVIKKSHSPVVDQPQYSIIMDRGIATSDNIAYLKSKGYSYFVIERRNTVKDYEAEFSDKSLFNRYPVSNKNEVFLRKIEKPECSQVLVYSTGKEKKEKAIVTRKNERFLEDANRLIKSNQKGKIIQIDKINQRIGRLFERYGAIASGYSFNLKKDNDNPGRIKSISLTERPKKKSLKDKFAGCYVIETDKKNYNEKEIWDIYMQLNKVESAFRCLKSELGTRPVYHQKDSRIESHIFISVIAYSILHSVEFELQKSGYNKSWETVNKILSTHQRNTIVLEGKNEKDFNIRVNSKPEKSHKEIYDKLGLKFKPDRKIKSFKRK